MQKEPTSTTPITLDAPKAPVRAVVGGQWIPRITLEASKRPVKASMGGEFIPFLALKRQGKTS